ncbi:endonuclease/exonuclease/phosphatase family protein [Fulvivirgaceae bacterium BMA12]|uniref:Endonuclease/exonuclease/phosphatase family protein n=1 Tax=Agaribacillus aureus TaxID=3051825 RepID=A0ABT8L8G3_9BACT|nr:endonuclease/exonuclease/phosphatase family protein [Fulvivirgaceae bacterium BMA12]
MIKIIITFLAMVFALQLQGQEPPEKKVNTLKVISYNIWNGFDWGKDLTRRDQLVAWIASQKPDVVALQELCGYTKQKLLGDAKDWGHNYAEILKTSGYPVGITSSKPIAIREKILEDLHHGALHCRTWDIDFMVVHFSPFSYKKRREETEIVLEKLSQVAKNRDKYIVLGDFNAVSPFDADLYHGNESLLTAMRASEKEHEHVRNLFQGQLEYGVLSTFLGFPLLDVTQIYTSGLEERLTSPTRIFNKQIENNRSPNAKRIDYILVSPYLQTTSINARVLNGRETFYLSDHYPVMAEFEL